MLKTCRVCNEEKNKTEFYVGHARCKKCYCEKVKKYRNNNLEKIREYDRKRGNRQPSGYMAEYRKSNPEKYKAHNMVNNAVRDGRMSKPNHCEGCGDICNPHGHHEDYSKPLDVVWLCVSCHRTVHVLKDFIE